MSKVTKWTKNDLLKLYKLREKDMSFSDIAKSLKKSIGSVRLKNSRMDWDAFAEDPDGYLTSSPKKWTDREMAQLDAFLQADKSYEFIAEKLDRSRTSVERQAQQTDWKGWKELRIVDDDTQEISEDSIYSTDNMVNSILSQARHDMCKLDALSESHFVKKTHADNTEFETPFDELKEIAKSKLIRDGMGNASSVDLESGRYVVVGDSHGKHTKKGMFALLRQINKHLKPKKIIHVGHILDDDDDISYEWGEFENLIVLARTEELRTVQEQRNKFNFCYDIVRDEVCLGDLIVVNQDLVSDYVKTPMSNIPSEAIGDRVITGSHRHEFFTRCVNDDVSYIASPGSLCEKHVTRTIKQIDFREGKKVKEARPDSFSKYRRMKQMYRFWEQGMMVVDIDKKSKAQTIVPCVIKKTSKGYTTSYFDKIISSKGLFKPSKKIMLNADIHSPNHDCKILSIQEQIAKTYKPDVHINLGDTHNFSSLNHHLMDRGIPILDCSVLSEGAQTYHVLDRIFKWADESYLLYGNHERFANDFISKYPQFKEYLDFELLCGIADLGYKMISMKNVLKIGASKYIHGDMRQYGQSGSILEKTAKTFGRNVFVGHIHYPGIRLGCYSVGLTGEMDQGYNEPAATKWIHGLGLDNHFENESFPTTIAIMNYKCQLGGRTFVPKDHKAWEMKSYKARIVYDVVGK